ncbi:MAG: DUF559 domain-containing protein [Frankiales bacterium]|nr:DUF559 domain-containing protein [Frankiales bacterium]
MLIAELPPVARAEAIRQFGRAAVDTALRSGELVRIRHGVVAGAHLDRGRLFDVRVELARIREVAAASHGTAAELLGLARIGKTSDVIRITRASGQGWREPGVVVGQATLPASHLVHVAGVRCTGPARTAFDLARAGSFAGGVVAADSALRIGATKQQFADVVADCRSFPHLRRAATALDFADERAESALESISRVAMHECGLPAPVLQAWIYDGNVSIGRVDFLWPEAKVIGEADGLSKYTLPAVLQMEKLRQEQLERAGYRVVRWTWRDVWLNREEWHRRLAWALGVA